MADISVIIDVLGAEDMEKAARVTQTLQNKVQSLGKQLQRGNITNRDYQRGVQQLIKKNAQHAGGYKNLQREVQRYSGALQRQINETLRSDAAFEQASTAINQHTTAVKGNTGAMATQSMAAQRSSKSMKQFASIGLQQVGYQVSDFTVQVQGGTSALVAFGQQGSQLAGLLFLLPGMFGAVAGAVVSIAIPVFTAMANVLVNLGGKAKDFEESLDNLKSVVSGLTRVQDLLTTSTRDLAEKYGDAAESVRQYARIEAQLQTSLARSKIGEAISDISGIANAYGEATRVIDEFGSSTIDISSNLRAISEDFGVVGSEAQVLRTAFAELSNASGFEEQRDAVNSLVSNLQDMEVGLKNLPPPIAQMLLNFYEANREVEQAEEIIRTLENGISDAADEAGRLKDNLALSQEFYANSVRAGVASGAIPPQALQDLPPTASESAMAQLLESRRQAARAETSSSTRSRARATKERDPAAELDKARAAVDRLRASYDESYATQLKVAEAQKAVNELIALNPELTGMANLVLQDYINSLDKTESMMEKLGKTMKDSLGDAIMGLVEGTKTAKDAFKDMARAVLKQAYDLMVIKPLMNNLFGDSGGGGGLLGGILGGLAGSFGGGGGGGVSIPSAGSAPVGLYANGGVVNGATAFSHSGGLGVMGEAGPEAIMPLRRGKNGKLGVQVEGGGQQPIVINQSFNFSANGDESVKRIIQQEAPKIANYTQKQILDQRRRGGALKQTFG